MQKKLNYLDQKFIWHPFTQQQIATIPIIIKKAKGSYVYDHNNKAYLDLISSWWVNLHGHANSQIANAIYRQAINLEHVIFAGFTHKPAITLCEKLSKILPINLSKFFFSDNGSTSTEVALKMAYQYWHNHQEPQRTMFLCFKGGYHGDTVGAMSVGFSSGFHDPFSSLCFKVLAIDFPETYLDETESAILTKENKSLLTLNKYLKIYAKRIAAIILEPLIQGASGMRTCRPIFIKQVITLLRFHNILIIFDEVMTGFGRTGTYFASEQIKTTPDFLCLSKGLTGGFLPLGLTITTEKIYKSFLSNHLSTAFLHGHSYTANPLACSAAIASLKLLLKPTTKIAINNINKAHQAGISYLKNHCNNIINSRILGTIAAFEVISKHPIDKLNKLLKTKFLEQGLLLRPLKNTIYLLPPYSITKSELEIAYKKINTILNNYL